MATATGMRMKSTALYRHASPIRPLRMAWNARCEPHPGQSNPVSDFMGQAGKNADSGSKDAYMAITTAAATTVAATIIFLRNAGVISEKQDGERERHESGHDGYDQPNLGHLGCFFCSGIVAVVIP